MLILLWVQLIDIASQTNPDGDPEVEWPGFGQKMSANSPL